MTERGPVLLFHIPNALIVDLVLCAFQNARASNDFHPRQVERRKKVQTRKSLLNTERPSEQTLFNEGRCGQVWPRASSPNLRIPNS